MHKREMQEFTILYDSNMIMSSNNLVYKKEKDFLFDPFFLPSRPQREIDVQLIAITRKKSDWKPPIDHPWRKFLINKERICKERNITKVGHF